MYASQRGNEKGLEGGKYGCGVESSSFPTLKAMRGVAKDPDTLTAEGKGRGQALEIMGSQELAPITSQLRGMSGETKDPFGERGGGKGSGKLIPP